MTSVSHRGADSRMIRRGYGINLKIACQNDVYTSGPLASVGDMCVISGKYLFDLWTPNEATMPWSTYLAKTQTDVENNLRNVFLVDAPGVSTSMTGVIVLDMEGGPGPNPDPGEHNSHPNHLWKETDADKALIIAAWKLRIAAVRAVFPNAQLGVYSTSRSGNIGDGGLNEGDGHFADRIGALIQAGTATGYNGVGGAWDGVDRLIPITYQIWGPNDAAYRWNATRARLVESIEGAQRIKKSTGASIPLRPMMSTCVFGNASIDDGVLLADLDTSDPMGSTWSIHLDVFEQYGVTECAIWNGINSVYARDGAGATTTKLIDMVHEAKIWASPVTLSHRRAQFE